MELLITLAKGLAEVPGLSAFLKHQRGGGVWVCELDLGEAHSRQQALQQNRHTWKAFQMTLFNWKVPTSMPNSSRWFKDEACRAPFFRLLQFLTLLPLSHLKAKKMPLRLLCHVLPLDYLLGFLCIRQFLVVIVQALLQLHAEVLLLLLQLHGRTSCQFPLSVPLSLPLPFLLPKSLQGNKEAHEMWEQTGRADGAIPGSKFLAHHKLKQERSRQDIVLHSQPLAHTDGAHTNPLSFRKDSQRERESMCEALSKPLKLQNV